MNCTPFRLFQSVGLLNVHLVGSISVADFGKIVKGFCIILSKCFRWLLSALFSKDTKQALTVIPFVCKYQFAIQVKFFKKPFGKANIITIAAG